jgi:ribosomal protein S12 methylthiotransferase
MPKRSESESRAPTAALVSLGCPKNLVDSERMLAGLALAGFVVTGDPDGADVAVVNTCAFIDLARAESDQHLDELEALKRAGRLGRIVVAGCMAQRYGRDILRRHPDVDAVVGVADREALADVCASLFSEHVYENPVAQPPSADRLVLATGFAAGIAHPRAGVPHSPGGSHTRSEKPKKHGRTRPAVAHAARSAQPGAAAPHQHAVIRVGPHAEAPPDDRERLRLTPRHYAYLRISEGCDNRCAYCAIPEIRGPLRSKPPEQVLAEARELVADGAKELILIGQDTTGYGRDFAKRHLAAQLAGRGLSVAECGVRNAESTATKNWSLGELLGELRQRVRVPWIRVMYTHPASFGDDVIEQLAAGPPLLPYVDLPLQHIADKILADMGRRVGRAEIDRLIARLRRAVPNVALRTSFIVGYPGETARRFEELLAFVEKVRFDHVGVFVYSREAGTRAAASAGQVPAAVARRRWDRLMAAAERLAHEAAGWRVGRELEVLVDGPDESGRLVARHAGQAPEVDSVVLLEPRAAKAGEFARVKITRAEGYDLVGEVIEGRHG